MNKMIAILALAAFVAPLSNARAQGFGRHSFAFPPTAIGTQVLLAGGGAYDPRSGFLQAGGEFRCTQDISAGPLAGCRAGEGVHWAASEVVTSTGFKCGEPAGEPLKTATTDDNTIVMQMRFFRQGDGNTPSFTAKAFVSTDDENPLEPGVQNLWIQGVGCGEAVLNFH